MKLCNICHSVWEWLKSSVGLKTSQTKLTGNNKNTLLSASASAVADTDQTTCLNNVIPKCCWIWTRFSFSNLFNVDPAWWAQSSLSVISGAEGYFPWKTWIHILITCYFFLCSEIPSPTQTFSREVKKGESRYFHCWIHASPSGSCSEILRFVEVVPSAPLWNEKKLWEGKWSRIVWLSFWSCSSIQTSKPQKNHL